MTIFQVFTVIFLVDQTPPKHILLLRRADSKIFAPGYFTGIGGKVGDQPKFANEDVIDGAYRELQEETLGELSSDNTPLFEFARFYYLHGPHIHYFLGTHQYPHLPKISALDGDLVWIKTDHLMEQNIIPTTKIVCNNWLKNQFRMNPFTVFGKEIGVNQSVRLVDIIQVVEGLQPFYQAS